MTVVVVVVVVQSSSPPPHNDSLTVVVVSVVYHDRLMLEPSNVLNYHGKDCSCCDWDCHYYRDGARWILVSLVLMVHQYRPGRILFHVSVVIFRASNPF